MTSLHLAHLETAAHVAKVEASALFEQHRQRVYRFCLSRLGDREEAHDAVQDTYAKAWLALRDGCEVRQPLPWLLTIARNVCASRYRARRARPVEAPLSEETVATVTSLPRPELTEFAAALRALPDEQRRAFVLRELRGCSYEEICDTMGTSQASVAALLHRARRSVAATLTGTGRRALVIVPFPAVLRSAFEGGGAVVAATAAATATGAMLLVGPHLPLQHHSGPSAPGRVHHATPARESVVVPAAVGSRFGNGPVASARPKEPVEEASPRVGDSPMLSSSRGPSVAAPVPTFGAAVGSDAPPAESLQPSADASAGAEPAEPTLSESSGGGGSTAVTPVATIPASTPASAAPAPSGDAQIGQDAATKSHANGPPTDPGSQGQGNSNAYGQGNVGGPPADPGSQGQGHSQGSSQGQGNGPPTDPAPQGQGQGSSQGQGNGPPADSGSQVNGQGVSNAGGNGQGGMPADPGSQGSQGNGSPGGGKGKDPTRP